MHNLNELSMIDPQIKHSHISNLHLDSVIQEKDFSINRLQNELQNKVKTSKNWERKFKKI